MIRRSGRILLRFLEGFAAGIAILAGFSVWFLSRGPISLDAVAPYVASVLSRGNGLSVAIDHTSLELGAGGHVIVLAQGVHLQREGGAAALTLADLTLEFSPRAALSGVIAPTRIIVGQPELRLERAADGSFHLGVGDLAADSAEDWGQKLVGDLVAPPNGQGSLGYLTEIVVEGASLTVDDRSLGVEWQARANASLDRASDHVTGRFELVMGEGASAATLNGDFNLFLDQDWLVVRLAFKDLKPALWADAAPRLAPLAALDFPVSGEFRAELDPRALTLRDAIVNVNIGGGALRQAFFPDGALPIASGTLQGGYDALDGRINLGLFALDLGAGSASVTGTIDGVGRDFLTGGTLGPLDADLMLAAQGVKVDDFPHLWPERAAADTRVWVVQHLHDGTVDDVAAHLVLHADPAAASGKPVELRTLDGTMKFEGLSVEYFRPLPLVRNVAGTAHFDRTSIDFTATGGDLGKIRATAGTAHFYQLDTHDEQAKVAVAAEGPLGDALAVLDTQPLGYAHDIGIDPAHASGQVAVKLGLDFPLKKNLPFDEIDYRADATLADVTIGAIMAGRDLSDGALTLKLDRRAAQVDGNAAVAGIPLTLSWRQSLLPNAPVRTHYGVQARLDDAQRSALGFDFLAGRVTGPVAVDAQYDIAAAGRGHVVAALDLKDAALDIKQLNWKKAAGAPALARVAADLADDKLIAIRDATVQGPGVDAKGSMSFDGQGIAGVAVDHLVAGENDVRGSLQRLGAAGWRVEAKGKSLDATGLVDEFDHAPPSHEASPPLAIELDLDRLILGPGREADGVTASLASDGVHWQNAHIAGKLSDTTSFKLDYDGTGNGLPFKLTSDDFGALLKLMGIYDDIAGGRFDLSGHAEDRDGKRVLVTTADGADYRVVRAPTLARLLSLASFSGMGALLTGKGIPFNRLEGEVDFTEGLIALSNARAYGGAIGINASGVIDRAAGQMNIAGTLVPAYTLNSVIGDIPVLGDLLVGGAGQGVFASNFRVFGPIDKPDVSVNALSTLAPGFLRNLFVFSPRGP